MVFKSLPLNSLSFLSVSSSVSSSFITKLPLSSELSESLSSVTIGGASWEF